MALRTLPDWEILCYPRSAIPRRLSPAFCMADLFGEYANLGSGDGKGTTAESGGSLDLVGQEHQLADVLAQADLTDLQGVEFVRFRPDGTVIEGASTALTKGDLGGYILQARDAYLDAKIGTTTLDTTSFNQLWTGTLGTWKTVLPPDEPRRTWIMNSGSEVKAQAKTTGVLPANRSLRFDLFLLLHKPGQGTPSARLMWGDESWSLQLAHGQKPTLEKKVNGVWVIIRRLEQVAPVRFNGGRYTIRVRRLAGRIVIDWNEATIAHLETQSDEYGKTRPVDVSWPSGAIGFNVFNCRARLGVALVKYANPQGVVFTGTFARQFRGKLPVGQDLSAAVGYPRGWANSGATVTVQAQEGGSYVPTLTASSDGIDTPFVTGCVVQSAPTWGDYGPTPLRVDPATLSGNVSLAMPNVGGGVPAAQANLELDRNLLQDLSTRWESYLKAYCPISIRVRWKYDDGSYDDWRYLFKGYITQTRGQTSSPDSRTISLTCLDSTVRLQKPAAVIDGRFSAPLDFLLQRNISQGNQSLYGYDCVQHILDTAVGREAVGQLQTYFPTSHPPLLSLANDQSGGWMMVQSVLSSLTGSPPTTTKWHFPPPFGDDALSWIQTFAKLDQAVFYFGHPEGDITSGFPVPIYGRLLDLIAGRAVKRLADDIYIDGDINRLLMQASAETRPDRDINRILVWGSPPTGDLASFYPAMPHASGEARLPTSDPNSAERTWERTLVVRSDVANIPEPDSISEYIARRFIDDIKNVRVVFPDFVTRGEPDLTWGDRIECQLVQSGCAGADKLGVTNQVFVVERVDHTFNMESGGANAFTTRFNCFPLANNIV